MKKQFCLWALLLVFMGIAACSEETREYTRHEPGVYKGKQDPLLAKEQHQALNDRLMMVQTDR
jgi:hypothetical protein